MLVISWDVDLLEEWFVWLCKLSDLVAVSLNCFYCLSFLLVYPVVVDHDLDSLYTEGLFRGGLV